ncbi:hypothetical protein C8Q77DRAFT_87073 [Trametes polyzona]|nr:hypothetical protein C8Q77DRAFT_87073 [Trametes polyzona]
MRRQVCTHRTVSLGRLSSLGSALAFPTAPSPTTTPDCVSTHEDERGGMRGLHDSHLMACILCNQGRLRCLLFRGGEGGDILVEVGKREVTGGRGSGRRAVTTTG